MKGILGKKLGMSQVFDPDTGVMTAVTVIEAGPCPVVQVKSHNVDGYDAIQLAFDEVAERKLSKAEVGHLRKAGAAPHRHLVELRAAGSASSRRPRSVLSEKPVRHRIATSSSCVARASSPSATPSRSSRSSPESR